jgi:hypothetical protein
VVRDPPRKSEQATWPATIRFIRQRVQSRRPRGRPTCTERRCGHDRRRYHGIRIQRPQWERLSRLLIAEPRCGGQGKIVGSSQRSTPASLWYPSPSKRRLRFLWRCKGFWIGFRLCRDRCLIKFRAPFGNVNIGLLMDTCSTDAVMQSQTMSRWTVLLWIGTHSLLLAATTGLELFIARASRRTWATSPCSVTTNTTKPSTVIYASPCARQPAPGPARNQLLLRVGLFWD